MFYDEKLFMFVLHVKKLFCLNNTFKGAPNQITLLPVHI